MDVEYAEAGRERDFPPGWGTPPGERYSEERADWVAANVRRMQADPERRLRKLERVEHRRRVDGLLADIRAAMLDPDLAATGADLLAAVAAELRGLA